MKLKGNTLMRLNPIICDVQTSHLLHTKNLTQLYQKIDLVPDCRVRYDGKEFENNGSCIPCELSNKHWWEEVDAKDEPKENYIEFICPLGAVNDFLWLQESWITIQDDLYFESDFLPLSDIKDKGLAQLIKIIGWQDANKLTFENARLLLKINELKVAKINNIWLWSLKVTVV